MSSNSEPASIGIIISSPPSADLEASELALALTAFEMPVQLFFVGLGVTWLIDQQARKPNGKAANKVIAALPMYGVEQVFCCQSSLQTLAIEQNALPSFVSVLASESLQQQLQHCRQCLTF